jgi:hypothetical protein
MHLSESSRRPMNVSQNDFNSKWDRMLVNYCAGCAEKHALPTSRAVLIESDVKVCDLCGNELPIAGRLFADNEKIEPILSAQAQAMVDGVNNEIYHGE